MVHTVSVQGVRWAWEEECEEQFEEIKDEKEDAEKVKEPCVKRLGDVVEDFGLKIPYKQPSQDSQDYQPQVHVGGGSQPQKTGDQPSQASHHQKAKQGFHTSRLFRDRVP